MILMEKMSDCLYRRLGVDKKCDAESIKQAYRHLAIKHHPDKNKNANESNNSFIKIKEAYEILSDPLKRNVYDTNINSEFFSMEYMDFDTIYKSVWMFMMTAIKLKQDRKLATYYNKNIIVKLDVSLCDIYNHKIKKIIVNAKQFNTQKQVPLYISLLNYQSVYTFDGVGDGPFHDETFGDITVNLNIETNPMFRIDSLLSPYDMHASVNINLYQYFYQDEISLNVFGTRVKVPTNSNVTMFKHRGMPFVRHTNGKRRRGNLYVFLHVDIANLKNIKEMRKDIVFKDKMNTYFGVDVEQNII